MGRDLHYRRGSFYRTDDRTGFPQRAERTRREWNGLIVDDLVWEARQPQDLVKGVRDQQSVPEARPLAPNVFVGPTFTALSAAAGPHATLMHVDSTAGFRSGDSVSIMMNNGVNHTTILAAPPGAGTLTLARGLVQGAAQGNVVTNNTGHVPAGQEP